MAELVKYEEARRLLAEAVAVDEVQAIRSKAEAMRAYARQAKDRDMEIAAAQIRFRAERRLGELIIAQKETVGLNRGRAGAGRPSLGGAETEQPKDDRPTLEQAGIDRKLSSRAQRMAAIEPERFEALLDRHREEVEAGNNKVSVDLMRTSAEADGRERRRALQQTLSDETAKLPTGRRFPVLYADPPWHRKQGVTGRSYENHYPTMTWDEICALPIRDLLLPDAWVFLWIPRAHMFALHAVDMEFATDDGVVITRKVQLPLAWAVARAWGCDSYSTAFVWTKTDEEHPEDQGGGVITFDQDEILLLFKRGRGLPKPDTKEKFGSNHRERSKPLGHSRKPEFYREMIATMCGGLPVMELFARVDAEHPLPPKWEGWGNQTSPSSDDATAESATITNETAETSIAVSLPSCANLQLRPAETIAPGNAADESSAGGATTLPVAASVLSAPTDPVDVTADAVDEFADTIDSVAPELAGASAEAAPPPPDSEPDEFTILKAFSSFATPDRFNIIGPYTVDYIARGLVFKYGGITDWGLTAAGYDRLDELKRERAGLTPKVLTPPAVSELSDDERDMREVLAAVAGAYRSDLSVTARTAYERDLIGLGFLSVIDDCGGLAVTEAGHVWLSETEAGSAPPSLTQPEPLTPVQTRLF
ncbi:MT-A70 family methyltransferase [Nitrobacter sp. TKz-YC01]|uniref:MT-A70 family methyltransferase n=1 Tax=Nitrobacter sp. TKz-YC01 TaxID=3398703 RepID=UPI003A0FB9E7